MGSDGGAATNEGGDGGATRTDAGLLAGGAAGGGWRVGSVLVASVAGRTVTVAVDVAVPGRGAGGVSGIVAGITAGCRFTPPPLRPVRLNRPPPQRQSAPTRVHFGHFDPPETPPAMGFPEGSRGLTLPSIWHVSVLQFAMSPSVPLEWNDCLNMTGRSTSNALGVICLSQLVHAEPTGSNCGERKHGDPSLFGPTR